MVVRVDEPGQEEVAREVQIAGRGRSVAQDGGDSAVCDSQGCRDELVRTEGAGTPMERENRRARRLPAQVEQVDGGMAGGCFPGRLLAARDEERVLRLTEGKQKPGGEGEAAFEQQPLDRGKGPQRCICGGGGCSARPAEQSGGAGVHVGEKQIAAGAENAGQLRDSGGEVADIAENKGGEHAVSAGGGDRQRGQAGRNELYAG